VATRIQIFLKGSIYIRVYAQRAGKYIARFIFLFFFFNFAASFSFFSPFGVNVQGPKVAAGSIKVGEKKCLVLG
jgi:hypothetical protein